MRTVLHLNNKMGSLIIGGDDRVVTAVSDTDVLRGDKPYRKYVKEVIRVGSFSQWNDALQSKLNSQPGVLDKALNTDKKLHSTRHPLGVMVGDFIKAFGWNAVVIDYIESPVSDYYGLWVMAAKNITRQQHKGELWATAFDEISMSTRDEFVTEYLSLVAQQQVDIEEVLNLADLYEEK